MRTVAAIWRNFVILIFFASLLFGLAAFGYQAFLWAKTGEWVSVPLAQVFLFYDVDLSSVYYPQDWKGVANATAWVLGLPLFLAGPAIGFIVGILLRSLDPFGIEEWEHYGGSTEPDEVTATHMEWHRDPPAR